MSAGVPQQTMVQLANVICTSFDKLQQTKDKGNQWRATIGQHMVTAIDRFDAGEREPGETWAEWCKVNLNRSVSDINKLIAIANSDDPAVALAKSNEKARLGMRESRARKKAKVLDGANVSGVTNAGSAPSAVDGTATHAGEGPELSPSVTATTDEPASKSEKVNRPFPPEVIQALTTAGITDPTSELRGKLEAIQADDLRMGATAMREAMLQAVAAAAKQAPISVVSRSPEVADLVTAFHDLPSGKDQAAFRKAIEVSGTTWLHRMTRLFHEGSTQERSDFISFIDTLSEKELAA